jgi:hypothetical protein
VYFEELVLTAANISIKNLAKKLPDLLQQKLPNLPNLPPINFQRLAPEL